MKLTKKHYKTMAEILRRNKCTPELCKEFGDYFEEENENFNFLKFMEAALGHRLVY